MFSLQNCDLRLELSEILRMNHYLLKSAVLVAVYYIVLSQLAFGDEFFVKEKNRLVPIVGADNCDPIVEYRGERRTVKNGEIVIKTGNRWKLSGFSVDVDTIKLVSHRNPSSKLAIQSSLRTDEAIEGAYLCIRTSATPDSNINTALVALPILAPGVENKISESIPLPLNWRLGPLHVSAFHEGKQIALSHKATELGRSKHGNLYAGEGTARTDLRPNSSMPEVLEQSVPEQPTQEVLDSLEQAYVTVQFFIDVDGVVREASSNDFTNEAFVALAIDALKKSKFSPAYKNGAPHRIKLKQTFWFKRPAQ